MISGITGKRAVHHTVEHSFRIPNATNSHTEYTVEVALIVLSRPHLTQKKYETSINSSNHSSAYVWIQVINA